jgi:protein-S-isoprenylcysteine O-methyltransferase Ste14
MSSPIPEASHAEGASPPPPPPTYSRGRRDLGLGVVIGFAVSVVLLLPALVSGFGGGEILPALSESGTAVVLVLVGIVIVIWAAVDGLPAWRNRTPRVPTKVTQ